jgi:hypothetical protein
LLLRSSILRLLASSVAPAVSNERLLNEGEAADRPKGHGGDDLGLFCASVCAASISAATALRAVLAAITIIAAVVDLNLEIQPWIGTGKHKSKMK